MTRVARPTSFGFVSGVMTDQLAGRSDFEPYSTALQVCENFTISPLGVLHKRRGFRHVLPAIPNAGGAGSRRLIAFDFNSTAGQSYVIEIGFNAVTKITTFRFFTQGGVVLNDDGSIYELTTDVITVEAAIRRMAYVQSVDRIYFADESFVPFTLNRMGHNNWTITGLTFTTNPSYPLPWGLNNYPRRLIFFEDRLVFGNCPSAPTTMWFSRTSQYTNFDINTATAGTVPLATDSIWIRMGGGKLSPIAWISDRRNLLSGTNDAEFSFSGATATDALTPENAGYHREGAYGSSEVIPLSLEDAVIFISRTRKKIFSVTLDEYVNTFKVEQLNVFCPEMTSDVWELCQTEDPDNIIWFQQANGELPACTYMREQKVLAWHRHLVAGEAARGHVNSIASIPTEYGTALWALIYYPEAKSAQWRVQAISDADESVYLDSYVPGTVTEVGRIAGLGIFADQIVQVVSSGGFIGQYTVGPDGVIESNDFLVGMPIAVGYPYVSKFQTLPIIFTSNSSTTAGMAISIHKPTIKFWQSVGGRFRVRYLNQKEKDAAGAWSYTGAYPHGARTAIPPEPLSYDWTFQVSSIFNREMALEFMHDVPYPCSILSMSYDLTVGGT